MYSTTVNGRKKQAMKFEPWNYQKLTIEKIIEHRSFIVLQEMGLGKTVSTLTAIWQLMYDRFEVSRVLVIAPLRVAQHTWPAELGKWDHLKDIRLSRILGTVAERRRGIRQDADIYVINRENVAWLVDELKSSWPFDMVVVDELSSFKSSGSRRFRALRKVLGYIDRIVGLTGTPAPNGLIDLWSQVYLIDRGERLGKTKKYFLDRYFEAEANTVMSGGRLVNYRTYSPKPMAEEAIYKKIQDICISMKSVDYLDMPERIDNVVEVILPPEADVLCKKLERQRILEFMDSGEPVTAKSAAALSNKLLQMANGAVYDEVGGVVWIHDEKMKVLDELLEEANGKPVMVFYSYRHDLARLKARYKEARTLDTAEVIDEWNAGRISMLLVHPASAGHGLNLQSGGSVVIWFGLTWSLELYLQANARIYRQGQEETVYIHHLVTKGSMDEAVMQVLAGKEETQEALMEAVKARIQEVEDEGGIYDNADDQ